MEEEGVSHKAEGPAAGNSSGAGSVECTWHCPAGPDWHHAAGRQMISTATSSGGKTVATCLGEIDTNTSSTKIGAAV